MLAHSLSVANLALPIRFCAKSFQIVKAFFVQIRAVSFFSLKPTLPIFTHLCFLGPRRCCAAWLWFEINSILRFSRRVILVGPYMFLSTTDDGRRADFFY
jgi:hypothetical protein